MGRASDAQAGGRHTRGACLQGTEGPGGRGEDGNTHLLPLSRLTWHGQVKAGRKTMPSSCGGPRAQPRASWRNVTAATAAPPQQGQKGGTGWKGSMPRLQHLRAGPALWRHCALGRACSCLLARIQHYCGRWSRGRGMAGNATWLQNRQHAAPVTGGLQRIAWQTTHAARPLDARGAAGDRCGADAPLRHSAGDMLR